MPQWTTTSSPTLTFLTSLPVSITTPAASEPEICGRMIFIPGRPRRAQISLKLQAEALTLITTSLGPALGCGVSRYCRTSLPPCRSKTIAFIKNAFFSYIRVSANGPDQTEENYMLRRSMTTATFLLRLDPRPEVDGRW